MKGKDKDPFDLVGVTVISGFILLIVGAVGLVVNGVIWPAFTFVGIVILMAGHLVVIEEEEVRTDSGFICKGTGLLLTLAGLIGIFWTGQTFLGFALAGMTGIMIGRFAVHMESIKKPR